MQAYVIANLVAHVGGTIILMTYDWRLGLGAGLLAWFVKSPE